MTHFIIDDFPKALLDKLETRAKAHGRTASDEARSILQNALERNTAQAQAVAATIKESLSGRNHTDSALLLAEDRGR